MAKRDYYEVLGVERAADEETIKKAYRQLALQHHPDRNPGDKAAEERFKEGTEAYEVLKDPEKRAAYDRFGHAAVDGQSAGAGPFGGGYGFDLSDALRAFMHEFGGFDLFGDESRRGRGSEARGGNRQIRLELTLEEIATGITKKVRVQKGVPCTACGGKGTTTPGAKEVCSRCGGSGQIRRVQRSIFGQMVNVTACSACQGEGEIIRDPCLTCSGEGRVRGQETVSVKIPAGVMEGNYITLRGLGDAGIRGAPPGDLIVVLAEKPHPNFERHGADILWDLAIHPHQAVLGARMEVPTLTGKVRMEVPPGIQSGRIMRLRGKGLPSLRTGETGDQLVRVSVLIPNHLTAEERKAYEKLAQLIGDEPPRVQKGFFERMRDAFSGS